jgi:hypothetical protein
MDNIYEVNFYEYIMYGVGEQDTVFRDCLFFSDYGKVSKHLTLNGYYPKVGELYEDSYSTWENGRGMIVKVFQRELL